jgi:hypothetical protein
VYDSEFSNSSSGVLQKTMVIDLRVNSFSDLWEEKADMKRLFVSRSGETALVKTREHHDREYHDRRMGKYRDCIVFSITMCQMRVYQHPSDRLC